MILNNALPGSTPPGFQDDIPDFGARIPSIKPRPLYLVLCIAGLLLPYSQFVPWVIQHGLNLSLFVGELFANRIGVFFGMDVVVSAVALLAFTRIESARLRMRRRWLVVIAVLTVGVSLGLPLFLYMRELELQNKPNLAESA